MTAFAKLKLTTATRKIEKLSAEQYARQRVLGNLAEQLGLVKAMLDGTAFTVKQTRYKTDENGERVGYERSKRLRQWFWQDADGNWLLELRYGNRPLKLSGENTAVVAGTKEQLASVIETLMEAVQVGELDKALAIAKKERLAMLRKG
ncbi:protein of unknown function [Magnetospirillum gryphiswaldense MSR-1 v2]|uniref:Uncharacterized protein n=1 Tax=Magnetospirillum gryphiswaldense (strain DSM 6361 / JCM 21280 / NBRC 15271 / MSR-1) TaxID=431944 RepID=V6EZ71_MAGGM|nr:hypothetical protein [Magnetospirillum gryphiswaldense]CDK98504.1 protein of unknown function [Magnetospirillum gryphiswaldense MSR-1 v2]